jgi:hypothetical protein
MDVYLGKNCTNVWLVDINPLSPVTDSLLFEWEDLLSLPISDTPLYCIIESPSEIHEAHQPKYSSNRLPKEVIDLSNGVMIDDFASQFQRELSLAALPE